MSTTNSSMHQRFRAVTSPEGEVKTDRPDLWFEPLLLEILHRPVAAGSARDAHREKEHEIGKVFASLTALESWNLHKRLSNPRSEDVLAEAFQRLIADRRVRLLAFLGDPRRRAAMARVG
ncbi:hypothetical protein BH11MYX3_BH11MYX3_19070 [soil metagenome]